MCLPAGGIWVKLGHTFLASEAFHWGFNFQISWLLDIQIFLDVFSSL